MFVRDPRVHRLDVGVRQHVGRIAGDLVLLLEVGTVALLGVDLEEDDVLQGLHQLRIAFRLTGEYLAGASPLGEEVQEKRLALLRRQRLRLGEGRGAGIGRSDRETQEGQGGASGQEGTGHRLVPFDG
jgi:hypothetical protein